jgi:hypothetical protein
MSVLAFKNALFVFCPKTAYHISAFVSTVMTPDHPCITRGQTERLIVNNIRPPVLGQHFIKTSEFPVPFTR